MKQQPFSAKTTAVEVIEETVEASTSPMDRAHAADPSVESLAANYHSIMRSKAIYYPVAYRFGKELGRGRQGVVFEAYRHGARGCITRHAIKLFDPLIYSSVERYWTDMGRIARQISKLQKVNSPNLTGRDVYEEVDGVGYLQMEAIEGIDGQQLLYGRHLDRTRQQAPPDEWERFMDVIFRREDDRIRIQPGIALYIMRQTLRGLEVLHKAGFIHSDVKPANIMLDKLGIVKLVDYGRATEVGERMSILMGTPLYMAPEVHERKVNLMQSDIYSVGLVGLELLRGQPLVEPGSMNEDQLLEFKLKLPDYLTDLLPHYVRKNREFVQLLRRFLDPNPAKRYDSAENAESTSEGLALLHRQLAISGKDTEYDRELATYLERLFPASDAESESMDSHENGT